MSLMLYWKGDNYIFDMEAGKAYHLNQNSDLMNNLQAGEHIWAFTRVKKTYVLATDLVVSRIQRNSPGYEYGHYRAIGDRQTTRYFDVTQGIDVEPLIRRIILKLRLSPRPAEATAWEVTLRGSMVRILSHADEQRQASFSNSLHVI